MHPLVVISVVSLLCLAGCASSGDVSPLVFCDRPTDFNAKVFTDCTPRLGGDSPFKRDRQDSRYDDDPYNWRRR
ncbi:MAG: hypothetical protein AAAB35_28695 [Phyllobacterium sp.]|uniref:hypothetical protein n=1 Tax=Phyllobacterium sp. TaxID=1871046 RepID=UPI0030F343B7